MKNDLIINVQGSYKENSKHLKLHTNLQGDSIILIRVLFELLKKICESVNLDYDDFLLQEFLRIDENKLEEEK